MKKSVMLNLFQHLQDLSDPEINSGWHTKRRSNIKCFSYL